MWPYKMWCDEQRRAIKRLFPRKATAEDDPRVKMFVGRSRDGIDWFRLGIACGWCDSRGCLQCAAEDARLRDLTGCGEWLLLWQGYPATTPAVVLADYAEEHGYDDVAELLRRWPDA